MPGRHDRVRIRRVSTARGAVDAPSAAPRFGTMLRVTFLGTASSRPTVNRNVSAIAVRREGRSFLFDCGEGTQRQMMRFGVGFAVEEVFITHAHADHYLGLTGLLRTLGLQGRREPLAVWGPADSRPLLETLVGLGGDRLPFPVRLRELPPGEEANYDGFRIRAVPTGHAPNAIGLALVEESRPGRFDVEAAHRLGVPEGPLFGRLHRGETVRAEDGRTVRPEEVVGPARPGRKVVYSGDTPPTEAMVDAARSADLLIHEATFDRTEARRAAETRHSTASQAARVAARAGVRKLVLTHLSARYADRPGLLLREARETFRACTVARDGMVVEVPFPEAASDPRVGTGAPDSAPTGSRADAELGKESG